MNLKDTLGYSNRKGNGAIYNFTRMLEKRLRKWVKHDKDAMFRLYRCRFEADYDWLNDLMRIHVLHNGTHIFTVTDPDNPEQMQALAFAIQLQEDGHGDGHNTFD